MPKKKPKKSPRKTLDLTLPVFQLKISLQHIAPPIWRRIQVSDCTLAQLHEIIQIVVGWEDAHLHAFVVGDDQYGDFRTGGEFDYDSRTAWLSEIAETRHTRFQYDYDFGDEWIHIIEIEKTLPAEAGARYPRCVDGARACPPEDSGGHYGYANFLEAFRDPEHEEHAAILEWTDEDFDPEKFDLEDVNEQFLHLRRWLGRHRAKNIPDAAFAKDQLVQVKQGVVHGRYPDIPLGGWAGRIRRIGWLVPIGYAVHWTAPTLQQAHPVYFKRCWRDGEKPHRYWLEEDQLEAAASETPAAMTQPVKIVTPPLSADDPDDRVRMVFGLTSDDGLPKVDERSQRQYLGYLKDRLSFPFQAKYYYGTGKVAKITVTGFSEQPPDAKKGILCNARKGKRETQVSLAGLQLGEDDPNAQYVEDCTYWMWDAQEAEISL